MAAARFIAVATALLSCAVLVSALDVVEQRSIPSTDDNQDFFSLSQDLLEKGDRKISSCGPTLPDLVRCINICNSPGLSERGGCCCIAEEDQFFIGLRGGCRYSQRVSNFTTRLIYRSSPISNSRPFFGATSCDRTAAKGNDGPCTCSIQWEANTDDLSTGDPRPSPSGTSSPVLTASPSSRPVEPSPSMEDPTPMVEPTRTPSPGIPIPVPDGDNGNEQTESPTATDEVTPTDGVVDTSFGPFPSGTEDAEAQAEDDDGSVCVDERYLDGRGFSRDSMVHANGLWSTVLCPDATGVPCGTRDHKVRIGGVSMSYEEMCDREDVVCHEDRMKVNSVYSHLWTDVAHEKVVVTMFDVRYGESAQMALHAVMRAWRSVRTRVGA